MPLLIVSHQITSSLGVCLNVQPYNHFSQSGKVILLSNINLLTSYKQTCVMTRGSRFGPAITTQIIHRPHPHTPTSRIRFKAFCPVSILLTTKSFSICLLHRFTNSFQSHLSKLQISSYGVQCDARASPCLMYSIQELLPIRASLLVHQVYWYRRRHAGAMDPFEELLRVGGEPPGLGDEISHCSRTEVC